MNYETMTRLLPVRVCLDPACGLDERWHWKGVVDPFGVVHFTDRRWSKAGARRLLLLAAKLWRERPSLGYLNTPEYEWLHLYLDARQAYEWALEAGFRLPAKLSWAERSKSLRLAVRQGVHVARDYPAIYQWMTHYWRDLDRRDRRIRAILERSAAPE